MNTPSNTTSITVPHISCLVRVALHRAFTASRYIYNGYRSLKKIGAGGGGGCNDTAIELMQKHFRPSRSLIEVYTISRTKDYPTLTGFEEIGRGTTILLQAIMQY